MRRDVFGNTETYRIYGHSLDLRVIYKRANIYLLRKYIYQVDAITEITRFHAMITCLWVAINVALPVRSTCNVSRKGLKTPHVSSRVTSTKYIL